MIQDGGPPASARAPPQWVGLPSIRTPIPAETIVLGNFCCILALNPLNRGLQFFDIVGLYLGLTNWFHNSPKWSQPPFPWIDVASNYLHPHVASMRLVHECHHLHKAPSIQAPHWAAKLSDLTAYPPHSAQGRRTFTINYWRPTGITNMVYRTFNGQLLAPKWSRNTGKFGELIALRWSWPYPFGWGVGACRPGSYIIYHMSYYVVLLCDIIVISYHIIFEANSNVWLAELSEDQRFNTSSPHASMQYDW